jgi:hypothetical protein
MDQLVASAHSALGKSKGKHQPRPPPQPQPLPQPQPESEPALEPGPGPPLQAQTQTHSRPPGWPPFPHSPGRLLAATNRPSTTVIRFDELAPSQAGADSQSSAQEGDIHRSAPALLTVLVRTGVGGGEPAVFILEAVHAD